VVKVEGHSEGVQTRRLLQRRRIWFVLSRNSKKKSLTISKADRKGIKNSKMRILVMVAASQTGEKLPLLVIGSAKDPLCFKINRNIVKKLKTEYVSSKKAWMTSFLFEQWMKK
jgi:DDE superfamily endonuclease